jgi:F-type H+-transporting ATPase subunit epsilon
MENALRLEIVTPYGLIFNGDVDELTATGSEGEFGVLPGHAPFITTLKTGIFTCKSGNETMLFFVSGGYAEVAYDKVTILAETAETADEIDATRAQAAKQRLKKK